MRLLIIVFEMHKGLAYMKLFLKLLLPLFSMGYFKNTTVWGHYAPPCNFDVSYSRRTKLGNMGYFDVPSLKLAFVFKFRATMT